ncbi:MAG: hypothetical protein JSW68_06335 [Burkholderiales bacterium]|nr:MAG: hypothetical protein JSW68_06335 [Burkholderiales bacterium]
MSRPPIGISAFVAQAMAGRIPPGETFHGSAPYLLGDLAGLAAVTLLPALGTLIAPRALGGA